MKPLKQKQDKLMNSIKQNNPSEIFNQSAVAIFIITHDHELIFWNKACEILTGTASLEVLNTKNYWRPFYREQRPCLADIVIDGAYSRLPEYYVKFGKSKLSPEGINAEGWYENLGGEKRYMMFDAVPVFNPSGHMLAAIESLHDLTELKHLEFEKEKLFFELNNHISKKMALKGFVCICSSCKNIRNKDGVWKTLEEYFGDTTGLQFTHSICPQCAQRHYSDFVDTTKLR
jgi:hypothetical protein